MSKGLLRDLRDGLMNDIKRNGDDNSMKPFTDFLKEDAISESVNHSYQSERYRKLADKHLKLADRHIDIGLKHAALYAAKKSHHTEPLYHKHMANIHKNISDTNKKLSDHYYDLHNIHEYNSE